MGKTVPPCVLGLLLVGFWLTNAGAPAADKKGKAGDRCGTIAGLACDAGLWCELSTGQCKTADAGGTCARVPENCTEDYKPVCGCDGKTYGNDCERQRARVQKEKDGTCET